MVLVSQDSAVWTEHPNAEAASLEAPDKGELLISRGVHHEPN